MSRIKYGCAMFLLSLSWFVTGLGQDKPNKMQSPAPQVTADISGDRVRITAPASVVQMRIQVYSATGDKLFDDEIRGGNVFDWNLQNGQAERLPTGDYVCVVTIKNTDGKVSQRVGSVTIADTNISLSQAGPSPLQAQAIGPLDEDTSWAIVDNKTNQTATVIAHDGTDGQITRGRGALSFRLGDFFSGQDAEQMRLTEEGNLGVGTNQPEAKLDIAGDIRTSGFIRAKGIEFADGTVQTAGLSGRRDAKGNLIPAVSGTGTQNKLAKWLDNSGTLGDSAVTEVGGKIGIGTSTPAFKLDLVDNTASVAGFQLANTTPGAAAQIQNRLANDMGALAYYGLTSSNYTQAPILSNRAFFGSFRVDTVIWTQTANDIIFATNGLGANTERMRIKAAGNIGVGTNNPQFLLDVAGDINTSTQFDLGGSRMLGNAGSDNLFVGRFAGANNTGASNTFVGANAGTNNTTGSSNFFVGRDTGLNNTTGSSNSFGGANAGVSNTTGNFNSFFGSAAGNANATGSSNSFFGAGAGVSSTTGNDNTFFGADAGRHNSTGGSNAFFGQDAGFSTTTGGSNSFFGTEAGTNNTIGFDNDFLGKDAGFQNTTGLFNSFIGASAGQNNTTGDSNIFLGRSAGLSMTTEDSNTFLGTSSDGVAGITNSEAIGAKALVTQSNSLVLGSINGVNNATADTRVGIGTTAPAKHLHIFGASDQEIAIESSDAAGRQWTLQSSKGTSSGRFEIIDRTADANRFTILSNGNVGIGGVTGPGAKLQVGNGDLAITTQGNGVILHATDGGNCFRLTVNDAGVLSTTHVACP